ncbi:MAG: S8 family serine peptidase, partial [Candidatus Eisenbacteria bacterium]|nr:S8 family serine peptidase [Candidatus Eisenbacteria bacterium]
MRIKLPVFLSVVVAAVLWSAVPAIGAEGEPISLYLAAGYTFDPATGGPEIDPSLVAAELEAGEAGYHVVQFAAPVGENEKALLSREGAEIVSYLPDFAYLVRVAPDALEPLRASGDVRWAGRWEPAYKISPAIGTHEFKGRERSEDPLLTLRVRVFEDLSGTGSGIEVLGAEVLEEVDDPYQKLLLVHADPSLLSAIASIEDVWWIEELPEYFLMNNTTKWVVQSNVSGQTPIWDRGLHGEGETVFLMDSGIDYNSCWFRGAGSAPPGPTHRKVVFCQAYGGGVLYDACDPGHGTHVAGTVAGDQSFVNPGNYSHNGMAYAAKIGMQDVQDADSWTCMTGGVSPPTSLTGAYNDAYNNGARIHTNSWGGSSNSYDAYCVNVDAFMANHRDFLILFAAGNAGSGASTVGYPGTAKNCITVGATRQAPNQETIAGYSSRGPTFDNRFKPTVCAPGGEAGYAYIFSADNHTGNPPANTCNVQGDPFQGTSMATPAVAGTAALTRQYFREGWYPGGSAGSGPSINPSAALVKAVVMNSAADMGTADIPNNNEGWGRVKLEDALYFDGDARELRIEDEGTALGTGQHTTFTYDVEAGMSLEIVLVWTDKAAAAGASVAIVNDLDLTVSGPSGTFKGNVFSGGSSVTGGSYDRRNVEEVVRIASPVAGTYTVRVDGYNVPSGPQTFALALTGAFEDVSGIDPTLSTVAVNDDVMLRPDGLGDSVLAITVTVRDGSGNPVAGIPAGDVAV